MTVDCSVVVPAFNATATIGAQLAALAGQRGAGSFEVIVADNGSTDDLAGLLAAWQARLPGLRHVDASRGRGVSVARNAGTWAAASERILVCDADDVVSPGWVAALGAALGEYPLVGGPVETAQLSGRSARWVPVGPVTDELPATWGGLRYPFGCNMAFRREVFDAVGGFDESFPPGGEEIDFAWRAADLGYDAAYVPEALLHYRIRPDLAGVVRQQFGSGRGTSALYAKHRPAEVVPRTPARRVRHELTLLRRFPWRAGLDARRQWLATLAFEAGRVYEARRRHCPAP